MISILRGLKYSVHVVGTLSGVYPNMGGVTQGLVRTVAATLPRCRYDVPGASNSPSTLTMRLHGHTPERLRVKSFYLHRECAVHLKKRRM